MRQGSTDLADVLSASFERELTANVFTGSDRMLEGVRFEGWQLDSDLSGTVRSVGSGVVVHSAVDGESLVPVGTDGVLSPFRARVELVQTIRAGEFSESVSLGLFRVVAVPEASDTFAVYDGRSKVIASRVAVQFESLDSDIERWGFRGPEQSAAGVSAYEEIRRLTGMPVEETVPDVVVPSLKAWEAKQGSRLETVIELGNILGGTAVVNSRGAWEIIPDAVGDPVLTLRLGAQGTVTQVGAEIETDTVYNEVVGSFEAEDGRPLYAVAAVTAGPLSVDGPYGANTRYYSSDLVKTQGQADGAVRSVLEQSISSQQYDVAVQCHVNPLVEIGDVVSLEGWDRPVTGRVRKVSLSDGPLMNVTIRVSRELA